MSFLAWIALGLVAGPVYGKRGKPHLLRRLDGYNQAAMQSPWLVLVDLDRDGDCAPTCREQWLPRPTGLMCFRIAVRAVEAWLLADREEMAKFLAVSPAKLPLNPELEDDPKAALVRIARSSRSRDIRSGLVPTPASARKVGPAYGSLMIRFIHGQWHPQTAAQRSDSLRRCLDCLGQLAG